MFVLGWLPLLYFLGLGEEDCQKAAKKSIVMMGSAHKQFVIVWNLNLEFKNQASKDKYTYIIHLLNK